MPSVLTLRRSIQFCPEALNLRERVITAGIAAGNNATLSYTQMVAADQLIADLKRFGLWALLFEIWVCLGSNVTAALQKLKWVNTSAMVNVGFMDANYSESAGLTGDGSKHLKTGFIPNTHLPSNTSIHQCLSCFTDPPSGANVDYAAADSAAITNRLTLFIRSGGNAGFDSWETTAGTGGRIQAANGASHTDSKGIYIGTRVSATDSRLFKDDNQMGSIATMVGVRPSVELYLYGRNTGGTGGTYCSRTLNFATIGLGLNREQVTMLTNSIQSFNRRLGRV